METYADEVFSAPIAKLFFQKTYGIMYSMYGIERMKTAWQLYQKSN